MVDQPPSVDSDEGRPQGEGTAIAGTPRWVKVSAVIAVALALLVGGMLAFGGGEHGPGRHGGGGDDTSGGSGGHKPPAEAGGHVPPPGAHSAPE